MSERWLNMPNEGSAEDQVLRAALGPGSDCPPIEQLEILLDPGAAASPPSSLARHVADCPYCQTELKLLCRFQSDEPDTEPVREVAQQLRARSAEILTLARASARRDEPWWKTLWTVRWLSPAALAMAAILVVVAIGLQWRQVPPTIRPPVNPDREVLRSNTIAGIVPAGDIPQVPNEVRWQPAPGAVKYEVRLMEVDRTDMWKAETGESSIGLPPQVRARIVPAKTMLWQVSAFDAAGHKIRESELVRFRVLQNLYKQ